MTRLFKGIWRIVIVCASCAIMILAMGLRRTNSPRSFPGQVGDHDKVHQAIKKLWSAEDTVRRLGREQVLQIGPAAVPALRDLLTDLIRDRRPRFATETEEAGRKALDAYVDLSRSKKEAVGDNEDFRTVSRLAINSRLSSDAISLLGGLRAGEGVAILIHIMERRSGPEDDELDALRRIGSAAIPNLIKSIDDAHNTACIAVFERPIHSGFSIHLDFSSSGPALDLEADDNEEPALEGSDQLDPEEKWAIARQAFVIKRKAIRVLGEIGDQSALPFLESLLKAEQNTQWNIVPSVEAAIAQIKGETRGGSFPAPAKAKTPVEP